MEPKIEHAHPAGSAQPHFPILHTQPLRRIYNHDIMNCTADGVDGNYLYSGRALGMTEEADLIQLSPLLKPEWPYICNHYANIGLEHTTEVIWNTQLEQLRINAEYLPSVFFFGQQENQVYPNKKWSRAVDYINSKNNFVKLAEQLGIPIPYTHCFDRVDQITPKMTERFVFPCYIKAAISVSGVGIYRCETPDELLQAAETFEPSTPVQVQDEVIAEAFLNIQYQVVNGESQRLLATEQILDGPAHQGNRCPAKRVPWSMLDPMAEWMAENGFQDIFAFDVAVVQEETNTSFLAIECNPRFNGASYPTAIALKLGIHEWEARIYKTWHKSLAEINLQGLEYDSRSGVGVIIVNWGTVLVGKVMVMLAGPEEVRNTLEVELKRRLW